MESFIRTWGRICRVFTQRKGCRTLRCLSHSIETAAGMMIEIAFAYKKEFGSAKDLLAAHAQWELNYWRGKASKVEGTTREDLSGISKDLKVTEMNMYSNEG